jgi:aldose 1-epimerase
MSTIQLENESLRLGLHTGYGGSVVELSARLGGDWLEVMRRPLSEPLESASHASSFVVAPYSNRIRDARFEFEGQTHQLRDPERHAMHGDVRNRPVKVAEQSSDRAVVRLDSKDHEDINFPFPFTLHTTYALEGATLTSQVELTNTGDRRMPAGFGYHPYFPRSLVDGEEVELQLSVTGVYPWDGDLPVPPGPPEPLGPGQDFSSQTALEAVLDHCFAGWDRKATITWPKRGVRLVLEADEALGHVIVFAPEGKPFFALEPVTNANDGFNLLARGQEGSGVVVLEPGQSLTAGIRLSVEG